MSKSQSPKEIKLPPFDPVALEYPPLSDAEFADLKASIRKRGFIGEIHVDANTGYIVEGVHRAKACQEEGVDPTPYFRKHTFKDEADKREFIAAYNLARRHLKPEDRERILVNNADWRKSDNALAEQFHTNRPAIKKARAKAEATCKDLQVEKRFGKDGKARKQPAKKKRRTIEDFRADIEAKQNVASKSPEGVSVPTPSEKLTSELPKDPGSSQTPKKSHIAWVQRSDGTKAKFKVHPKGKEEMDQIDRLARKLVQSDIETARELMVLLGYGDTYQIICALDSAISEIEEEARLRAPASIETPPNDDGLDIPTYLRRAPKEPVP
jgi:ParB-like chromosome segregation protein Spo0J